MRTLVVPLIGGAVVLIAACGGSAFSNGDDTGGAPSGAGGTSQGGSAVSGSSAGGALGQGGANATGGLGAGGAVSTAGGGTAKGGTNSQGGGKTTFGGADTQGGSVPQGGSAGKGGATAQGGTGKGGTGKGGATAQGGTITSGGAIVSGGAGKGGATGVGGVISASGAGGLISASGAGGVPSVGGVGGVPSVGGADGATGGVCRLDADCHISTDCCSCFAAGPGEATTICKSTCKQTACAAAGVADSEVACVAGRCVIARSCVLTAIACDAVTPTCEAGQLPSILNGCYGPCLPVGECSDVPSCKSCEAAGLKCVTIQAQAAPRYHCVSTPPACEKSSTCSCMSVCLRPYQCNAPESTDLTCGCPTC